MNIIFGEQEFVLHHSGALFWPARGLLIVADLHLEKSSYFAQRGYFLPPYDSRETLMRLRRAIQLLGPRQVMILGDCFHDNKGFHRLLGRERVLFDELLMFKPLWIRGNHDGCFVPPGFAGHDDLTLDGIRFSHEATRGLPPEICGHYHPKADVIHKGASITRSCFVEDGQRMILPAFGAYTGGLSIEHPSIAPHLRSEARVYLRGQNKIYALPRGRG